MREDEGRRLRRSLKSATAITPVRVALYARYSTDLQDPRSIADQFLYCRQYAERQEGWRIVRTFEDAEVTGDTLLLRAGVLSLLEAAKRREFDIILIEDLDRLSRRPSELSGLHERLSFTGVALYEVGAGEADEMRVGLKGIINSQFLKNLRLKLHRTGYARAVEGKSRGPARYGYRVVKQVDENGDPVRGDREIDPAQAEIVVRVLTEYAAGVSPSRIARQLNREGIPGPKGHKWTPSAIIGVRFHGQGLINCELYVGILIWNRTRKVRNPETGKFTTRLNPRETWVRAEVPHLRIVSDELWAAVKARQDELTAKYADNIAAMSGGHLTDTHRPNYPFSGRVFCHHCGGPYVIRGGGYYGCANHLLARTCPEKHGIKRVELEERVTECLLGPLTDPMAIANAMTAYKKEAQRLNREWHSSNVSWRKELQKTERHLDEIVHAIEDGGYSRRLAERLRRLEAIRDDLENRIAAAPSEELPIPSPAEFRKKAENLIEAMNHPKARAEAIALLQSLIRRIEIKPESGWRPPVHLTVYGDLAALVGSRITGGPKAVVIATV